MYINVFRDNGKLFIGEWTQESSPKNKQEAIQEIIHDTKLFNLDYVYTIVIRNEIPVITDLSDDVNAELDVDCDDLISQDRSDYYDAIKVVR